MRLNLLLAFVAFGLLTSSVVSQDADDSKPLQGVWVAESMEVGGKPAPAEEARRMRFSFKGAKLFIAGNFKNDREDECSYILDGKKSPKHLTFTPPKEEKAILGIYQVKGDELKICLRHAGSSFGRPTGFDTKNDPTLILMVLKRKKP